MIQRVYPSRCRILAAAIVIICLVGELVAFTPTVRSSRRLSSSIHQTLFDEIKTSDIIDLPIYNILDTIRESLCEKPNLLLEAAPGAGKTTVVPLLISSLTNNEQNILVVEPRRVATRLAAARMSNLINQQQVGKSIGYAIRGESKQSSQTSILAMTDGVLLNMIRNDPELVGYGVVILDEFHERGVGSDTALALLREVQINYRSDLKIVVMSATLLGSTDNDEEEESTGAKLLRALGGSDSCNILRTEGRQYPITIQHSSSRTSPRHSALVRDTKLLVQTMSDAIEEGLLKAPEKGDVLAFLPGVKEIRRVVKELNDRGLKDVDIFPLYGALPKVDQDRAIFKDMDQKRRVIISSPISEASLTISGVTCVVDSGLQRQPRYDANTGLPHLITVACSRDSVVQRAGRAGRIREGHCIRLFSEAEFDKLSQHSTPEIFSTDLVPTTLLLTEWGCTSAKEICEDLPFIDPPPKEALQKAYQMLIDLGGLEEYKLAGDKIKRYKVTSRGKALERLATHPRFATSIIQSSELGETEQLVAAVTVAALLDQDLVGNREANLALRVRDVLKGGKRSYNGKQLLNFASRISVEAQSAVSRALSGEIDVANISDCVGVALLPGFIDLIAQRKGDASYGGSNYMLSVGQSARLDDKQNEGEYLIVVDTSTGDDGKTRIRAYSHIESSFLQDVSIEKEEVYIVASKGYEVRKRKVTKVGTLALSSTPLPAPTSDEVTDLLLETIETIGGVSALLLMQSKKNIAVIMELQQRIQLARNYSGDCDSWPKCFASFDSIQSGNGTDADEQVLTLMIEPWLGAVSSLKSIDMLNILSAQLSPDQQNELDRHFPSTLKAPDGSSIPITYTDTGPLASAKLQQFFGQLDSPTVGPLGSTIPVSLSLLSPSGKPLAQTIDLPFFWRETYPSIRAEMRGRYPKHPWPEDPATAVATRMTKKQQANLGTKEEDGGGTDKRKERNKQRRKKR